MARTTPSAGRPVAAEAIGRARSVGDRLTEAKARLALAEALESEGELGPAAGEATEAAELSRPVRTLRAAALACLGRIQLTMGHEAGALVSATEASTVLDQANARIFDANRIRLVQARVLEQCGALSSAQGLIAAAREEILSTADRLGDAKTREAYLSDVPEVSQLMALSNL